MNKPNLPEDPKHIIGMGLAIPIKNSKTLVIIARHTTEKIMNHQGCPQIPITEYSKLNNILEWFREKYEYERISPYILELLDQPDPDWDIYKYDDLY
ncbi:16806_t:CDS:2 [Gigaspora margarita]|uniref:16806_t:CDS:1 n=1 Tax=Gigaspora margarita TaxID=4874 RepID=A0ABN7VG19_GIGMA|nr:16806_t:CDS:2 [Gigaspora margarita]